MHDPGPLHFITHLFIPLSKSTSMTTTSFIWIRECKEVLEASANRALRCKAIHHCIRTCLDFSTSFRETLSCYCHRIGSLPRLSKKFAFAFIMTSHGIVLCCRTEGFPTTHIRSHSKNVRAVVSSARIVGGYLRSPQRRITFLAKVGNLLQFPEPSFYSSNELGGHSRDPKIIS